MELGDPLTNRALRRRDVASDFEVLDSLLSTLTDVLDVRQVFDRVSKVVQPILPHDIMGVVEVNEAGNRFKLLAGAGSRTGSPPFEGTIADPEMLKQWDAVVLDDVKNILPIPERMEIPADFHEAAAKLKYDLVDDTSTRSESLNIALAKMGFLSVLRIPIFLNGKFSAGVAPFFSGSSTTPSIRLTSGRLRL
jgi:hypothetical protein